MYFVPTRGQAFERPISGRQPYYVSTAFSAAARMAFQISFPTRIIASPVSIPKWDDETSSSFGLFLPYRLSGLQFRILAVPSASPWRPSPGMAHTHAASSGGIPDRGREDERHLPMTAPGASCYPHDPHEEPASPAPSWRQCSTLFRPVASILKSPQPFVGVMICPACLAPACGPDPQPQPLFRVDASDLRVRGGGHVVTQAV